MEAARSLRLDGCVTKPFAFEEILSRVKELTASAGRQLRT
jgi:hypothetical protein